jgi:hypothetical protein
VGLSAGFQYFLDEPTADAMSHQQHARRRTIICRYQLVEELAVCLDLGGKRHGGRIRVGVTVGADVGRQAEVRVSEDDQAVRVRVRLIIIIVM